MKIEAAQPMEIGETDILTGLHCSGCAEFDLRVFTGQPATDFDTTQGDVDRASTRDRNFTFPGADP
jgi:hypothetical protein